MFAINNEISVRTRSHFAARNVALEQILSKMLAT